MVIFISLNCSKKDCFYHSLFEWDEEMKLFKICLKINDEKLEQKSEKPTLGGL